MGRDDSSSARGAGRALVLFSGLVGFLALIAFFVFDGVSYLADQPEACTRCHVMRAPHASWQAGRHDFVVCNDCHTPADPMGRAITKARSGLAHAWAYTSGRYPDEIRITSDSARILDAACRGCHATKAESVGHGGVGREERRCLDCHRQVGHADSRSTS